MYTSCTAAGVATLKPAKQNLRLIVLLLCKALVSWQSSGQMRYNFWLTATVLLYDRKDSRCNTTDSTRAKQLVTNQGLPGLP